MRGTLLAMLVAAGVGLAGTAGVSAAPINGAVIGDASLEPRRAIEIDSRKFGKRDPLPVRQLAQVGR